MEKRIKKIGIIGEGKMGSGIFNYLLGFGFDLVWICSSDADLEKLLKQFSKRIKRLFDAGVIDQYRYDHLMLTPVTRNLIDLHDCDLIIEAIPENLALKRDLFAKLDLVVKPEAIFSSNSSSINPSQLSPQSHRSGKFTGMHFFYPVPLKNIVEVTITGETTAETRFIVESFLASIQRRFITLDEGSSFLLNKILLDFQNEAFLMVKSGQCSHQQMDQLVKNHFFSFGVFDFCDSVGLDTMLSSILNYTKDYVNQSHYSPLIEILSELTAQGKLGMKSQQGFYSYPMEVMTVEEPGNKAEIVDHLRLTWLSSVKRFTSHANIPADDASHAIREYFDAHT